MDFREKGKWIYAMKGPEGEEAWASFTFEQIEPLSAIEGQDSFTDEEGNINEGFPRMYWRTEFSENELGTLIENKIVARSKEDLQTLLSMGFKEGYEMGLDNLEEYLTK